MINVGDEVLVYINTPKDTFKGRVSEVNSAAATDVWYKVKPYGEGVAQGRAFWHRESHVRRVNRFDDLDSIGD
ncbi:MAG: hypothetical protein CMQ41_12560 [Gammaproteobacteria bacterium]|nr:hypothetical protein [Gammaproteobacteria bacterium]